MRVFAVVLASLALSPAAYAGGPTLRVGASEDAVRKTSLVEAKAQLDLLKLAGLDSVRLSSIWTTGATEPSAAELKLLGNVVDGGQLDGLKVYISVANAVPKTTPLTDDDQSAFAQYAAAIATKFPKLAGLIVGNEPNQNTFWLPQFNTDGSDAAAPAYESLLAKTYDAVKAVRPSLRVIGGELSPHGGDNPGGARPTHSPTLFIKDLGAAYRASGRTLPIMDAFGFHPYGDTSSQSPTFTHPTNTTITLGDYDKLVTLLGEAFDGTAQPGSTLPILYDEYGVESQIPAGKAPLYAGTEPTTTKPVDEVTQGVYYRLALTIVFCQPNVEGILLFHAFDEPALSRWQSGIYYADRTPKPSLAVVRSAAGQVRRGILAHCDGLELAPKLRYLLWPRSAQLKQGHVEVKFTCDIDCRFDVEAAGRHVTGVAVGAARTTVAFPGRVRKGTYKVTLSLTAPVNPGPPVEVTSPPLHIP